MTIVWLYMKNFYLCTPAQLCFAMTNCGSVNDSAFQTATVCPDSGQSGFSGLASCLSKSQKAIPHHVYWAAGQLTHLNQFGLCYPHWKQTVRLVCRHGNEHKSTYSHTKRSVANVQWLGFSWMPHSNDNNEALEMQSSVLQEHGERFSHLFNIHSWAINVPQLVQLVVQQLLLSGYVEESTELICLLIKSFWEINLTPKFLGMNHLTTAHSAENSISQETGRKESGNETGRSSVTEGDTKKLLSKK